MLKGFPQTSGVIEGCPKRTGFRRGIPNISGCTKGGSKVQRCTMGVPKVRGRGSCVPKSTQNWGERLQMNFLKVWEGTRSILKVCSVQVVSQKCGGIKEVPRDKRNVEWMS